MKRMPNHENKYKYLKKKIKLIHFQIYLCMYIIKHNTTTKFGKLLSAAIVDNT